MGKLIELPVARAPRRPKGDIDCQVRQEDLAELQVLRRQWGDATRALRNKTEAILWMLLNHYPVEPGPHTAYAQPVNRPPYRVNGSTYYRIMVR